MKKKNSKPKKSSKLKKNIHSFLSFEYNYLTLLIGICPMLAASTNVLDALAMGIAAMVSLIVSALLMKLLSRAIPDSVKGIIHVFIAVSFIAMFELVIHAYLPNVFDSIGIYLPLVVVSGILSYSFDGKKKKVSGVLAQATMWTGAFFASTLGLALVREFFGRGTLAGFRIFSEEYGMTLLTRPAGGLILLGVVIALLRAYVGKTEKKEENK